MVGRGGAGVLALSIAGGGGNGGTSASGNVSLTGAFSNSVGGYGNGGGKGGAVTVLNYGTIAAGTSTYTAPTDPARATQGILAISVGGGGGRGGIAVGGDVTATSTSSSLTDTVGGGSGNGGTGGAVSVTNYGVVKSFGDMSTAVTGMSIGGRGGLGGIAIGGGVSTGTPMAMTLGSNGGNGGTGGTVQVENAGTITSGGFTVPGSTAIVGGFRTIGLVAQSIGGHGGMGGISLGMTIDTPQSTSASLSLGGSGGGGGTGGTASAKNDSGASISTNGPFSAGMVAQSLGGNGGIGGLGGGVSTTLISPSMTLGGNGGNGADGGSATANNAGTVTTLGLHSIGVLAQSIGGNGGMSGATLAVGSADRAAQVGMTLGNAAGTGGDGGTATTTTTGTVTTSGMLSTGVSVESIGGGGGRAGVAMDIAVANLANTTGSTSSIGLGSQGGAGGDGGAANLNQTGIVTTNGYQSDALYAGSVGGGGGSGGVSYINMTVGSKTMNLSAGGVNGAAGDGGTVTVYANQNQSATANYAITSIGPFSHGVFAQSVGGGGGSASALHGMTMISGLVQGLMNLGGTGSATGDGGTVNVTTGGQIYTGGTSSIPGPGANGILAQSIGGGGGQTLSGLISATVTASIPDTPITITAGLGSASNSNGSSGSSTSGPSTTLSLTSATSTSVGAASSMSVGGYSSNRSNAGAVTVTSSSTIVTAGMMSDAIKVQSIGGGGGASGFADINSGSPFAATTMTLGGGGNGGGYGGTVTVNSSGTIFTEGGLSMGILAQSLGSGGGDVRHVSMGPVRTAYAANLGIKATAYGGDGGYVTVNNTAYIATYGFGADGLVAQSIGGGGGMSGLYGQSATAPSFAPNSTAGSGGAEAGIAYPVTGSNQAYSGIVNGSVNGGAAVSTATGISMAAMMGAAGGTGASANDVNVTSNAYIFTGKVPGIGPGDGSVGIIAQAIGGGGGVTRQHTINFDQSQVSMGLTMGTVNNANGNGDTVNLTNNTASWASNASVTTAGQGSMALLAQSIGGGGGLGMLTAGTSGAGGSASIAMVLGAQGTASGYGNPVTVNSGGIITTTGAQAEAIVAQSIGSGGGVGKAAIYSASSGTQWNTAQGTAYADSTRTYANASSGLDAGIRLGANATGGSNSDVVTVTSSSTITTSGVRSTGIVAQSIAGGGGLVDITANALNGGNLNAQVILGGNSTSNPGDVNVTTSGVIQTSGALADGILAQSITAGGGSFGLSHTGVTASGAGNVQFIIGSDYQNNNTNSRNVTINSQQGINTNGFGATGITAQSIGSGGGLLAYLVTAQTTGLNATGTMGSVSGSGNGGDGGTVSVTTSGTTNTNGNFAHAIVAQSIGAGGGRLVGTQAGTNITLGSKGYSGNGGSVTVTNNSTILTNGLYSHGIVAQSIGGGGGLVDIQGTSIAFGSPSSWGSPDPTLVNVNAAIVTNGTGSMGVIAQSIAGGGGLAVASGTITLGASKNAGQYNGDTVTVNVGGSITTYGNSSPAVVAYSAGGGGGVAFVNSISSVPIVYNKGNGNASDATINVNQNIVTKGSYSHGAIAASLAGGGGLLIGADGYVALQGQGSGSAGTVQINVKSGYSILTYGTGSTATWGIASKGKSDPEINIAAGATVMGGPSGYGVLINGEVNNVNNYGTLGTFDGVNGMAIKTDPGVTTINNGGRLTGSVQLGSGANAFNNLAGGVVVAGPVLDLSATGVFNNAGVVQSGGGVAGGATVLTGNFIQSQGGLVQSALGANGQASQLIINGNATFGGQLGVAFADNVIITQGNFANASLITVNGNLTNAGLSAANTAMVRSNLTFSGNRIGLSGNVNFSPAGLSPQAARFGAVLANYQAQGSSPIVNRIVHDLVQVPNVNALNRNYNDVAGSPVSSIVQTGLQTAQGGMMAYAEQADQWRRSAPRPQDKLWQMWIAPFAAYSNIGASTGGMNASYFGASAGVDLQVMPDVLVGLGVTGSQNNVKVNASSMNANQGAGGAGLYGMAKFGQAYVSAASYVGLDHTSLNRGFMTAGRSIASFDATVAGLRFEAGYAVPVAGVNVTPFVAFEPTWRWQNGATETLIYGGMMGPGLTFLSQTTTSLPLILGVQLDTNMTLANGHAVSAFIRAGWMHEFDPSRDLTKSLPGMAGATFTSGGDYAFANAAFIRVGAQYKLTEQMSFFADINSQLAQQGVTLGGQIGMKVNW